jgi:hypothetical protein
MARVAVSVSKTSRIDVFPMAAPVSDPTNDHDMPNNGATVMLVVNVGGSSHTAQVVILKTIDGQTPTVINYAIPAGAFVPLGPYPVDVYGDHLLFNTDHVDLKLRAFSLL